MFLHPTPSTTRHQPLVYHINCAWCSCWSWIWCHATKNASCGQCDCKFKCDAANRPGIAHLFPRKTCVAATLQDSLCFLQSSGSWVQWGCKFTSDAADRSQFLVFLQTKRTLQQFRQKFLFFTGKRVWQQGRKGSQPFQFFVRAQARKKANWRRNNVSTRRCWVIWFSIPHKTRVSLVRKGDVRLCDS